MIVMISRLISIIRDKINGKKRDYFIDAKYNNLKKYYGETVLDIGAGNCDFSQFLFQQKHTVKAIDITNKCRHASIDFTLFDGQKIPFADNSTSTSISLFVLHHTNNQEQLLLEMKRVTTGYIIVAEDIINNWFDKLLGNIHLNTAPWAKGSNSFRTNKGWLEVFRKLDLQLVETQIITRSDYPVYPVQRIVYVLAV